MLKTTKADLIRLFSIIGKNRNTYLLALLFEGFAIAISSIITSYAFKVIIDFFVYRDTTMIISLIVVIFLRVVMDGLISPLSLSVTRKKQEAILRDVRKKLFRHLTGLPVSFFKGRHSGDILVRINSDVDSLKSAMTSLERFAIMIVTVALSIPYFIYLDYRLTSVALGMGILFLVVTVKVINPLRKSYENIRKNISHMSVTASEGITGVRVIRMFGLMRHFEKRFNNDLNDIYEEEKKNIRLSGILRVSSYLIWRLGGTVIAAMGAWYAINGTLELSNLVAAVTLSSVLILRINSLGVLPAELQKAFTGIGRLFDLLGEKLEVQKYSDVPGTSESSVISMRNVSFSYEPGAKTLRDISMDLPHEKTIALVGDSGSGKSTILKLIMGLYKADNGEITVNGQALGKFELDDLRRFISYVPQDAFVFSGTIRENILFGKSDAIEEEIITAAKKANAHEFIMKKTDGYDTLIGERGVRLSGGERQRVAIARAIIKDAPLLIFDEATSSLDRESELLVQNAVENMMKAKSSIVVAHRLSTIELADCIYFVKEGQIVESGSHDQLIARKGYYHELYHKTFGII